MNATYALYNKREYLAKLAEQFDACGKDNRILLMAMEFDPSAAEVVAVLASLEKAAGRGAQVYFGIDARTFLGTNGHPDPAWYRSSHPGPLWFHRQLPATAKLRPPYRLRKEVLDRLNSYPGAKAVITNPPTQAFSVPIAGRSHIKAAVINDYILLGGCNLDHPEYTDLMIGWHQADVADKLYKTLSDALEVRSIRTAFESQDKKIRVDDDTQLIIDSGVRGQSSIFVEALRLIDSAKDWLTITCQFFPNGVTADHLLAARKRGVTVEIIYAHPSTHGLVGGTLQFANQAWGRLRLPHEMFASGLKRGTPKIHAKLIASDAGVVIGSHNYVNIGVRLGTAEIALYSRDEELARDAREKIIARK
jgi:hypothetical protein